MTPGQLIEQFMDTMADQVAASVTDVVRDALVHDPDALDHAVAHLVDVVADHAMRQVDMRIETMLAAKLRSLNSVAVVRAHAPRRLGIAELERRFGVDRSTIWRWCRRGAFPVPHYIGQRRTWLVADVEAWEAREVTPRRRAAGNLPGRHRPGACSGRVTVR